MTALSVFCAGTVVFLVPRDLFLPETRDVEVWFGFELRGTAALWTAPIHWAIFALGAWGFWRNRPWILLCASAYVSYVALSHVIWSEVSPNGNGWPIGLLQAAIISVPAILLARASRESKMKRIDSRIEIRDYRGEDSGEIADLYCGGTRSMGPHAAGLFALANAIGREKALRRRTRRNHRWFHRTGRRWAH